MIISFLDIKNIINFGIILKTLKEMKVLKKSFGKIGKSVVATTIALSVLATPISYKTFAAAPDHSAEQQLKKKRENE